jgi:integrase/recombinase XerD
VRSFLQFAQTQGVVATGPLDLLVRPTVTVTSLNRYLDVDELQKLVTAARKLSPRHLATIMLLVGCGLRVTEASSVTWRDLFRDPQGRLGLRVIGKGQKERVVSVRDDVFATLVALHGSDNLDTRDTTPLLLDGQHTGYGTRGLHKLVAEAGRAAELTKDVSPHWLRHTHATLAALGGASAFVIQSSLGYSRLDTSPGYVHWARGLEDSTSDYLPELS